MFHTDGGRREHEISSQEFLQRHLVKSEKVTRLKTSTPGHCQSAIYTTISSALETDRLDYMFHGPGESNFFWGGDVCAHKMGWASGDMTLSRDRGRL